MVESDSKPLPRDVLIMAPNWLGDVVMTTPLLAWLVHLDRQLPAVDLRLHLAVRAAWEPLFRRDPRLTSVIPIARPGRHDGVGGVWRLARRLRDGRFAAVIVGPPSLRAALVSALAGIPRRIGQRGDGRRPLLTDALARETRGARHYSREMLALGLRLAHTLGGSMTESGLEWPAQLPGCDSVPAAKVRSDRPLWCVGPGATYGQAKTWPAERLGEFLAVAVAEHRVRFLLLGDDGAAEFVSGILRTGDLRWNNELADPDADVVDLTGRTDLLTVVGLLKSASAFVGNDSGLMHLAAVLGVPTVGIFGSSNPAWTAPLGEAAVALAADGFACRPCYRRTCNEPVFCLQTVTAAEVLAALRRLPGVLVAKSGESST